MGKRPKCSPCCSGRNTGPLGGADGSEARKRQSCLLKEGMFVLWLIEKRGRGFITCSCEFPGRILSHSIGSS